MEDLMADLPGQFMVLESPEQVKAVEAAEGKKKKEKTLEEFSWLELRDIAKKLNVFPSGKDLLSTPKDLLIEKIRQAQKKGKKDESSATPK
jgi:hypothetical protein